MTGEVGRRRRIRRALRRLVMGAAAVFVALLGLLSMGTAVGRYSALAVDGYGSRIAHGTDEVVVAVPVSTLRLKANDIVAIPVNGKVVLYRVGAVDSWTKQISAQDVSGTPVTLKTGTRVARVTHAVPYLGRPLRLFHGTIPGLVLLVIGVALLLKALTQRRLFLGAWKLAPRRVRTTVANVIERPSRRAARRYAELIALLKAEVFGTPAPLVTQRSIVRGKWWWTRLLAIVAAISGVFSMTASANFTAAETVSQGAVSTGVMDITVGGGVSNLTTGATGLVPGDLIARAIDVKIESTTTSGIITGMKLGASVSGSSSPNGGAIEDSNGAKVFVKSCSVAWLAAGNVFTCGGTPDEALGTNLHATPAAADCPPNAGNATVPTLANLISNAQTLDATALTLTPNTTSHLVVYMCLPTTMGDTYQNASVTGITWTFSGIQRSATAK
jgi:hypothetical protein